MAKGLWITGLLLGLSALSSAVPSVSAGIEGITDKAPPTTILPAIEADNDFHDYRNLIPQNRAALYYAEHGGRLAQRPQNHVHRFASLNTTFRTPTVMTERSDLILNIGCTDSGLDIVLADNKAFDIAKRHWRSDDLVFLTHGDDCGKDSHQARTYWDMSAISFTPHDDGEGGIAHVTCKEVHVKHKLHNIDLKWGSQDNSKATRRLKDRLRRRGESIPSVNSPTKLPCKPFLPGLGDVETTNWCKPNFDSRLDKKIGFTTLDEDSFVPALQEAAQGLPNVMDDGKTLNKRHWPFDQYYSGVIPIDAVPETNANSPWGDAVHLGSDGPTQVFCVGCETHGQLTFAGGIIFDLIGGFESVYVDVEGFISSVIQAAIKQEGPISAHFEAEIWRQAIPLLSLHLPGFFTLGVETNFGVSVDISADNAAGKLLPGGSLDTGFFKGHFDIWKKKGELSGLNPSLLNQLSGVGDLSITETVRYPMGLFLGLHLLDGFPFVHEDQKFGLQLTDAPGYQVSTEFNPTNQECPGVSWDTVYVRDISVDFFWEHKVGSVPLYEWRSDEHKGCLSLCDNYPADTPIINLPPICRDERCTVAPGLPAPIGCPDLKCPLNNLYYYFPNDHIDCDDPVAVCEFAKKLTNSITKFPAPPVDCHNKAQLCTWLALAKKVTWLPVNPPISQAFPSPQTDCPALPDPCTNLPPGTSIPAVCDPPDPCDRTKNGGIVPDYCPDPECALSLLPPPFPRSNVDCDNSESVCDFAKRINKAVPLSIPEPPEQCYDRISVCKWLATLKDKQFLGKTLPQPHDLDCRCLNLPKEPVPAGCPNPCDPNTAGLPLPRACCVGLKPGDPVPLSCSSPCDPLQVGLPLPSACCTNKPGDPVPNGCPDLCSPDIPIANRPLGCPCINGPGQPVPAGCTDPCGPQVPIANRPFGCPCINKPKDPVPPGCTDPCNILPGSPLPQGCPIKCTNLPGEPVPEGCDDPCEVVPWPQPRPSGCPFNICDSAVYPIPKPPGCDPCQVRLGEPIPPSCCPSVGGVPVPRGCTDPCDIIPGQIPPFGCSPKCNNKPGEPVPSGCTDPCDVALGQSLPAGCPPKCNNKPGDPVPSGCTDPCDVLPGQQLPTGCPPKCNNKPGEPVPAGCADPCDVLPGQSLPAGCPPKCNNKPGQPIPAGCTDPCDIVSGPLPVGCPPKCNNKPGEPVPAGCTDPCDITGPLPAGCPPKCNNKPGEPVPAGCTDPCDIIGPLPVGCPPKCNNKPGDPVPAGCTDPCNITGPLPVGCPPKCNNKPGEPVPSGCTDPCDVTGPLPIGCPPKCNNKPGEPVPSGCTDPCNVTGPLPVGCPPKCNNKPGEPVPSGCTDPCDITGPLPAGCPPKCTNKPGEPVPSGCTDPCNVTGPLPAGCPPKCNNKPGEPVPSGCTDPCDVLPGQTPPTGCPPKCNNKPGETVPPGCTDPCDVTGPLPVGCPPKCNNKPGETVPPGCTDPCNVTGPLPTGCPPKCTNKPGDTVPPGCVDPCIPVPGTPLPKGCPVSLPSKFVLGDGSRYGINASPDGNFYLERIGASSTVFEKDKGLLLSDPSSRYFHFYGDTMDEYGVSRMRLSTLDQIPETAKMFAFVPVDNDGDDEVDQFIPIDVDGNVYYTVVCQFKGQTPKLFLENQLKGYKALYRRDAVYSITGGQVQYCKELTLRGKPSKEE